VDEEHVAEDAVDHERYARHHQEVIVDGECIERVGDYYRRDHDVHHLVEHRHRVVAQVLAVDDGAFTEGGQLVASLGEA
jgi:hypothetical protein